MTWQTDAFQGDLFQIGGHAGAVVANTALPGLTGAPRAGLPTAGRIAAAQPHIGGAMLAGSGRRKRKEIATGAWVSADAAEAKDRVRRLDAAYAQVLAEEAAAADRAAREVAREATERATLEAELKRRRTKALAVKPTLIPAPAVVAPSAGRIVVAAVAPVQGAAPHAAAPTAGVLSALDLMAERNRLKAQLARMKRESEDLTLLLLAS